MINWLTRLLRIVGTGIAFALFGLGGLLYRFPIAPTLNVFVRNREKRVRLARRITQCWFAFFVQLIRTMRLCDVVVKNPERLKRPGLIVVANHPSLIDIVCLISLIPNATTIVKAKLLDNPFTRSPILAAGYVANSQGPELVERACQDIDAGATMIIFPEGTRTPVSRDEHEPPHLHRGAAAIALAKAQNVTPVKISAQPRWLTKDVAWWHLPDKMMILTFEVLEDIDVSPWIADYNLSPSLAARRLTRVFRTTLF